MHKKTCCRTFKKCVMDKKKDVLPHILFLPPYPQFTPYHQVATTLRDGGELCRNGGICIINYTELDVHSQYEQRKKMNVELAQSLKRVGDKHHFLVKQCAERLEICWCPECGKAHVAVVWCCRHRLCPICALRRSRKTGGQALDAFDYMQKQGLLDDAKMYLLTLTQRNVDGDALGNELDSLLSALKKMKDRRIIERYVLGSARNIEITYNKHTHTYHPHIHMILIFRGDVPQPMMMAQYWRDSWRELMNLDYEPICDIRPIENEAGAVCEVSKYAVKPSSIFSLNLSKKEMDKVVKTLCEVLHHRQLTTYTGIWRKARAVLKQGDVDEDLEHDNLQDIVCGCGAGFLKAVFEWNGISYIPMTAE